MVYAPTAAAGWQIELRKPIAQVRRGEDVAVYHQEACRRCGGPFATLEVTGRRIETCPVCQT